MVWRQFLPLLGLMTLPVMAVDALVGRFSLQGLVGWEEHSFEGNTQYKLVEMEGQKVLQARTQGAASGLFYETKVDLTKTPYINWRWRVEQTYGDIDERSKQGDDYPARVYVVKEGGLLPWRTLAVDYVWSSNQAPGADWPNAYTDKAHMVALRSGDRELGQWLTERRNVREDFQTYFGEDVRAIHVVAIMTDGDNGGGSAQAYYGDIYFSAD